MSVLCLDRVKLVSLDAQTATLSFQEDKIIELSDDVDSPSSCTLSSNRLESHGIRIGKFSLHFLDRGGFRLNGRREILRAYHIFDVYITCLLLGIIMLLQIYSIQSFNYTDFVAGSFN